MTSPLCKSWRAAAALDEELGGRDPDVRRRASLYWLVDDASDRLSEAKAALGRGENPIRAIAQLALASLRLWSAARWHETTVRKIIVGAKR